MEHRRMRARIVAALLALAGTPAAAAAPTGAALDERLTLDLARRVVGEVAPAVERLRGLAFEHPVPVEVVDDAGLRRYMLERLEDFGHEERLGSIESVYRLLGLVPADLDLLDSLLGAMEEQAGGYYDPGGGAYYLLDDAPAVAATLYTAHELTHALEDQHFDLDRRLREVIADEDRLFARSAIHEGSAMLLMSAYTVQAVADGRLDAASLQELAQTQLEQQEQLAALPPVLLRQLLGPYVLGASFLTRGNALALLEGYPKDAVDRAYRDPPASSEQILHPEKYWGPAERDDPQSVRATAAGRALGRGFELRAHGVLGELALGVLVGAGRSDEADPVALLDAGAWTNEASAGWDGDRWELWARKDALVLVVSTVWDSAEDAAEFAGALASVPGLQWRREGDRVAIVAGNVAGKAPRVLARVLRPAPALPSATGR
jgi:hypothetical protein